MRKRNLIYIVVILISIFFIVGDSSADEIKKEESKKIHKTVIIHEEEGVTPKILNAEIGVIVNWVNLSLVEAEIRFIDKKVNDAADCPVDFFIGKDGTYESKKMCAGCTTSLCFQKKGRFEYIIKEYRTFHGGEKEFRGTILIK